MTTQPEQVLENNLVHQLIGLGHNSVVIKTESDLLRNLKAQLEKHILNSSIKIFGVKTNFRLLIK